MAESMSADEVRELVDRVRAIGIYLAAQRGQASGIVLEAAAALTSLLERAEQAERWRDQECIWKGDNASKMHDAMDRLAAAEHRIRELERGIQVHKHAALIDMEAADAALYALLSTPDSLSPERPQ